jgi:hypothetical protein
MDASTRPQTDYIIAPGAFALSMRDHWKSLGNTPSDALMSLWATMGETFGKAIAGNPAAVNPFQEVDAKWHVVSPPCGAGKTQGLRIYSALLAVKNLDLDPSEKVGTLIVTREIEECDRLASEINESYAQLLRTDDLWGAEPLKGLNRADHPTKSLPALARHSKSPRTLTLGDIQSAQTLIVTHAAYVQALDKLTQDSRDRWETMIGWEFGQRRLVVVDESIGNLSEDYQLELDSLNRTLGNISADIRDQFPGQLGLIRAVIMTLEKIRQTTNGFKSPEADEEMDVASPAGHLADASLWDRNRPRSTEHAAILSVSLAEGDMSSLRAALKDHYRVVEGKLADRGVDLSGHVAMSAQLDRDLKSVQSIVTRWGWYSRKGKQDTLNSSRLLLPEPFPVNVVALDATARQEILWEMLGRDRVERPASPKGVRDYSSVKLYVSRARGLGKGEMTKHGKHRLARLVAHLNERFTGQTRRKVFLALHQAIEHHALGHELSFGALSVAHWNAIDGKNKWGDHDTAIIFGLPYRSRIWANNLYQAFNGRQDTEWLRSNNELRSKLDVRHLTTSITQAVARVRLRRVVNDKGGCLPCEVFVFLPEGEKGDAILSGLREEMPGIVVTNWEHSLDGPRAAIRRGSSHDALVVLMGNLGDGEWSMAEIERELSLTVDGAKNLRKVLRDSSSPLAESLAELGVRYEVRGAGRAIRAFLVKRSKAVMPQRAA